MVFNFESKNIFLFESRIVSNYVSNHSWVNGIFGQNASMPTILKLKLDTDRDTVKLGLISNSLWWNNNLIDLVQYFIC